jgi:hypothetical protein
MYDANCVVQGNTLRRSIEDIDRQLLTVGDTSMRIFLQVSPHASFIAFSPQETEYDVSTKLICLWHAAFMKGN